MSDAAETLGRGLAEIGLEASEDQRALLLQLTTLTHTWGQRLNLTGHRTEVRIVERLVLDAAALCAALPSLESLADLGSGAGYPGLPLAILRPELSVTLVEARERRHHLLGRAESLPPRPHSGVIAQAMAQPEAALAWMLPWAAPGAWLILPGGEQVPEIPSSQTSPWIPQPPRYYQVPCGGPARTLWLALTRR
jgi:16S rRNA (guanine527-N7)-methyltransferase